MQQGIVLAVKLRTALVTAQQRNKNLKSHCLEFNFKDTYTNDRGGGNWLIENQNSYISGTDCPIDLKSGCKFKFVSCLETNLRTFTILGHEGTLQGPFFTKGPLKLASQGPFWGPLGGP